MVKNNLNLPENLKGKIAIVTGANSGIGFQAAKLLAQKNVKVIFACRNEFWGKYSVNKVKLDSGNTDLHYEYIDLADISSIHKFVEKFKLNNNRLDILINNAGIMMCPHMKTKDGFEMQMGTNHLGHFALTGLVSDLLSSSNGSRVVSVSSLYHRSAVINFKDINSEKKYHPIKAYEQSKLANLLFTYELDRKFKENKVNSIAVASHPGWTATNLQKYRTSFKIMNHFFAQKPEIGVLPIILAAVGKNVNGGDYFGPRILEVWGRPKKVSSSKSSKDLKSAEKLWDISESLTKVKFNF